MLGIIVIIIISNNMHLYFIHAVVLYTVHPFLINRKRQNTWSRRTKNSPATVIIEYCTSENGTCGYKKYRVFTSPSSDFPLAAPFGGRRKSSLNGESLRVFICTDDRRGGGVSSGNRSSNFPRTPARPKPT